MSERNGEYVRETPRYGHDVWHSFQPLVYFDLAKLKMKSIHGKKQIGGGGGGGGDGK